MDTVFRFIYFRVGNRQLAEDLTSDTFLRALKRIGSFTWQGRDLGAWLVTIARNLVADHFKSGRYRLEVTTGDVLDADREDRGPEGSPESAVVDHITNVTLLTAVKQLNPEQQECIVLRFLQGFSVAETAQTMGKNEGAIKALQYRAVRALARLLPDGFQAMTTCPTMLSVTKAPARTLNEVHRSAQRSAPTLAVCDHRRCHLRQDWCRSSAGNPFHLVSALGRPGDDQRKGVCAVNSSVLHRRRSERYAQLLDEASGARRHHARSSVDDELE